MTSRWIMSSGPHTCAGCSQPLPRRKDRTEAKVGQDGKLYCHDTTCEADALAATAVEQRNLS